MLGRKQIPQLFPKDDSYLLFIFNLLTNRKLINKCGKSSKNENPKKKGAVLQGNQYYTGDCFGLVIRMKYFDTNSYQ